MRIEHHSIAPFKVQDIIDQELPFVSGFNNPDLIKQAQECYQFYEANAGHMPFVAMREEEALRMAKGFYDYACLLKEAAVRVIQDPNLFQRYLSTSTLSSQQLELMRRLAQDSLNKKEQALYGRFDAAFGINGSLTGIYEYNGDTPTMLFESANIQNMLTDRLYANGNLQAGQFNDIWGDIQENLGDSFNGKRVAVLCTLGAIEDLTTCETLSQIFEEVGANVRLARMEDLQVTNSEVGWEFNLLSEPTFRPEKVFVLLPWEEMLDFGHDFFIETHRWAQDIQFFEPAWKWVMGHKGLMAYIYDCQRGLQPKLDTPCSAPILKTTFTPLIGEAYVSKPVVGQRSMNVRVHKPTGEIEAMIPGPFEDDVMVYQEYCEPNGSPIGKLVACGWTTFDKELRPEVTTIAFRAFDPDLKILDQVNERIIPHIVYPS